MNHLITDVYVISFPKCGRTWLRILIGRAFQQYFNLAIPNEYYLNIHKMNDINKKIPRIAFRHENSPQWKKPEELSEDKSRFKKHKVIFLVRDPRDVLVSLFYQKKKRLSAYDGTIHDFIREPTGGIESIIKYYNIWSNNKNVPKELLIVRYEDLISNTHDELSKIMRFFGFEEIDDTIISDAVEFASFGKMRKMENENFFSAARMKPAKDGDESSFKTRKGKVGGYKEILDKEDIEYLDKQIHSSLLDVFRY